MKNYTLLTLFVVCLLFSLNTLGQDSTRFYFNSSVGLLNPIAKFAKSYSTSPAVNSGFEYFLTKKYFIQGELGFNAVKYSQQIKDPNSVFLFQNTNSSVLMLGINLGRKIHFSPTSKLFIQPYVGIGYANIGEPRLLVDNNLKIIKQEVTRMQGIFTKLGNKFAYRTKSKVLQTVFIDASYWSGYLTIQESKPQGITVLFGTKVGF
jgi:Outer membrane protein beta-barrel domain